jgi:hypothetical protein
MPKETIMPDTLSEYLDEDALVEILVGQDYPFEYVNLVLIWCDENVQLVVFWLEQMGKEFPETLSDEQAARWFMSAYAEARKISFCESLTGCA